MAAEDDQSGAEGGGNQRSPSDAIETLAGEYGSGNAKEDGHGTDHQRCVADRGVGQAVELDKELDGNPEGGGDKDDANLACREAYPINQGHWKQADAGKKKSVEHHVLHAHLVQSQAAEVEAGAPEASGYRACAIAQKLGARS